MRPTLNLTEWAGLAKGDAAAARAIHTAHERWAGGVVNRGPRSCAWAI